ncbi:outer membrane beta-barrel domain-containing protein [Bdellovibrio bacteriovorus]|uniref:outer membrane beta-barrel domain-containing protein n=1 Tax=Bdellovibrio bacteriovorus TaxID=959 RepID=UPI0035A62BA6
MILIAILLTLVSIQARADDTPEQQDIDFVERLLETKSNQFRTRPTTAFSPPVKTQKAEYATVYSEKFYSDLAIIQRNYMPKTKRIQLSGGFTILPTDVFYRTVGINLKTSYHLNETWGLEAFGYLLTSQARNEVSNLESVQKLSVKNLISVSAFYGANIYFNSIYGKTALLNSHIIPFEVYQTIGVGKVRTQNDQESNTVQIGIGDAFSLSRSSTLRMDLTWAFYNATNYLGENQASNSLFLTVSYGHFFPEPVYR